ncbi:MAG: hypothetical protein FWD71_19685 [Oscillospiraceae bacterium]|nr:hypothetical protein [Oscillospiraceae bacterium]
MGEFIKKRLLYKSTVFADVLVGAAIILAGYFYYYENKKIVSNIANPWSINSAIKITVAVIIIVIWMWLCFQNGVKKRRSFVIWTLCIWVVPQIVRYMVDALDTGVYSSVLQGSFVSLTRYLANINYLSLKTLGDTISDGTGISYYITLNVLVLLFEIMFLLGLLAADRFNIGITGEKNNSHTKNNMPQL